jgi:hypothetical protein
MVRSWKLESMSVLPTDVLMVHIFELHVTKGVARVNNNILGYASWRPPNHTKWAHVHPHGSVSLEHVAGDVGHLCPCLLLKV